MMQPTALEVDSVVHINLDPVGTEVESRWVRLGSWELFVAYREIDHPARFLQVATMTEMSSILPVES